jgi:hypothetical protein
LPEFIVIHAEPYRRPAIINIDAIAVVRSISDADGSQSVTIVMTNGVTVATGMTFEALVNRLQAKPA